MATLKVQVSGGDSASRTRQIILCEHEALTLVPNERASEEVITADTGTVTSIKTCPSEQIETFSTNVRYNGPNLMCGDID